MRFIPDRTKQTQEFIFSRKTNTIIHPPLHLNNATVKLMHTQKHFGLQLRSKLSFNKPTNNKIIRATKCIGLLRKLQPILPGRSFFPHLDYGDVTYDQLTIASFSNKIHSV